MNEDTFFDFFPEISEKSIKLIFHFPTLLFSGKLASFPQKLGFEKNRYKIFLGKKRGAARNFERHSVCAPYSIVSLKYVICKVQKICGVCADLRRLPQVFADFFRFSIRNESLILELLLHNLLMWFWVRRKVWTPEVDWSYVHIEIWSWSRLIIEIVKKQQKKQEFWCIHHKSAHNSALSWTNLTKFSELTDTSTIQKKNYLK